MLKGYPMLILLTAVLLLLLPLPALPARTTTQPPPSASSAPPPEPSEPPTGTNTADEGVFTLLCGEETVTLTERDFLIRSLAQEMSPTYHPEALKAQAVATYTYYSRRRKAQKEKPDAALKGADCATPNPSFPTAYTPEELQKKWGEKYSAYYNTLSTAVDSVLGKAMTRDGEYIDACYFAISNGCTESAETVWGADIPYLQAVASPGDRLAEGYQSTATFTPEEIKTALADTAVTLPDNPADWFGKPTLSEAGTVTAIPVGNRSLPGTEVRKRLGLRSATFSVVFADGKFTFTVQGYGHGVGMSQYGANYLAELGYTWQEILQYYYTDITIV